VSALNPVRELQPGDSPRDWMESTAATATAWTEPTESTPPANDDSSAALSDWAATSPQPAPARAVTVATSPEPAPARLEPQRYLVQFEASEEYVELVERAKALLSHTAPRADLGELHLRAMRCLVAELERQKYAVTARPRSPNCRRVRTQCLLPARIPARTRALPAVRLSKRTRALAYIQTPAPAR
jgi:hypothetical protein